MCSCMTTNLTKMYHNILYINIKIDENFLIIKSSIILVNFQFHRGTRYRSKLPQDQESH